MALDHQINGMRLDNLGLSQPRDTTAAAVVSRLAAVQAQDFYGALWALGQRLAGAVEADIEAAFDRGDLLRTHCLRPTWHFVSPQDIGWLLNLTGQRVLAANAYRHRQLELDAESFKRSERALAKALAGATYLTRDEIGAVLETHGVPKAAGQRLAYLVMHAELRGVICSGPRRGKQFTYALLDERAPGRMTVSRDEALAELARRFFATRGPATVHDFAKWSGLKVSTARHGLEAILPGLTRMVRLGQELWLKEPEHPVSPPTSPRVHLMSIFDEYISSYDDRSTIVDNSPLKNLWALGAALRYLILLDGRLVGTWRRTLGRRAVQIQLSFDKAPSGAIASEAMREAEAYAQFLGRTPEVTITSVG